MNVEKMGTALIAGIVTVTILTTLFGRSNTPRVFDSIGRSLSAVISASLGKGADLR